MAHVNENCACFMQTIAYVCVVKMHKKGGKKLCKT